MPLFSSLPPPPNGQSIAEGEDAQGKKLSIRTNWTWQDWMQRLWNKLATLTVLPTLGTTNQLLGVNAAGTDLEYKTLGVQGVAGTLPATSGGTGLNTFAVGDLLYANSTSTLARLADVAAGSFLRSGGVGVAPAWSTTTWPNSATTGDLLYASAANTYSNRAAVADGQVLGSAGVGVAPAYRTLASLGFAIDYANMATAPTVGAGTDGIAIGDGASIGAGSTDSIAIGRGASVAAGFTNVTAIGALATAGAANAVVIGNAVNNGNASINISASPTPINLSNSQNAVHIGTYRNGGQPFGVNGTVNNFIAIGTGVNTDFAGECSWSQGNFVAGTSGTAKVGLFPMRAQTTDATLTPLGTATGANPTGVNPGGQIVLPTVSSYAFECLIIARRTDADGTNAAWRLSFSAKKDATNGSVALVGTRVKEILQKDAGAAAWDVDVAADTGTGAVYPTVTGEAGKTIRWVAGVRMTKVMES